MNGDFIILLRVDLFERTFRGEKYKNSRRNVLLFTPDKSPIRFYVYSWGLFILLS